jgi:hypothetical protein
VDDIDIRSLSSDRENYIRQALEFYRGAPGTTGRVRREDRLLAADLHDRGVSLSALETAFVLATARRCFRPSDARPLAPVRSMYYFIPVIEEILANPPDAAYIAYLKSKIKKHTADTVPSPR